jgi:RHS repeat-associated protein
LTKLDAVGRLTQRTTTKASGAGIADYRYAYNLAGEVTSEQSHGETVNYAYDLAGQLIAATRTVQPAEAYTFDASGNATEAGQVVGPMNRIVSDATFDYRYDDEGNLTQKTERASGVVTSFTYDFRNRLTAAESRSAGGVVLSASQFTYDVYDRVIVRSVNGVSLATVYDGANPWADAVAGSITARYLYGDGADEILARWRSADGTAWYLADKQGTIRDLVDNSGSVVARRDFDSFGRILSSTGSVDRFAFQGREWEASVSLYQFRARWYDPLTRQFTTTDPLGFAAGDPNT